MHPVLKMRLHSAEQDGTVPSLALWNGCAGPDALQGITDTSSVRRCLYCLVPSFQMSLILGMYILNLDKSQKWIISESGASNQRRHNRTREKNWHLFLFRTLEMHSINLFLKGKHSALHLKLNAFPVKENSCLWILPLYLIEENTSFKKISKSVFTINSPYEWIIAAEV